jgi:hypothetical protein
LCAGADEADLKPILAKPILDAGQTFDELRRFVEVRLPLMPRPGSKSDWEKEARRLRTELLAKVILRGQAASWDKAKTQVVWQETLAGGAAAVGGSGYQLKKLRFEALPGLWVPALLYEPIGLMGKVPATLNVMGHEPGGKDIPYQQIRCINLARRGMLALNVEWFKFGQLAGPGHHHACMNQLDLCGSSGLAPFYLTLKRSLDVLLSHPHADPERVAVSGLSGGGWQTILISALDERVTLANPVAGYSSLRTDLRVQKDVGDSEQSPCDLATVADYDHLTALLAPRAALLTYNAKDDCCFQAAHTLPPLLDAAAPFYQLYGRRQALRGHVNHVPGTHNFDRDNREAFYRMIGDHFYPDDKSYRAEEIPCEHEIKNKHELLVAMPKSNADFNSLARSLAAGLPREADLPADRTAIPAWQRLLRAKLTKLIRAREDLDAAVAAKVGAETKGDLRIASRRLKVGRDWTVPFVELEPVARRKATGATIVLHDGGRSAAAATIAGLVAAGQKVIAVDLFSFGEARAPHEVAWKEVAWVLLVSAVGERPLAIQAGQLARLARWTATEMGQPVKVLAIGPRSSMIALVAGATEVTAIASLDLQGSLGSLKELIEQNRTVMDLPEMFCFGLLESFDIKQLAALNAPRPIRFLGVHERARKELAGLREFIRCLARNLTHWRRLPESAADRSGIVRANCL